MTDQPVGVACSNRISMKRHMQDDQQVEGEGVAPMTHEDKIAWMAQWAARNRVMLDLEGEVGFGRECVGISAHDNYPDYEWFDDQWGRIDGNGDVWTPDDAYHKHPCVAVLGRGIDAEEQLYEWLRWFDANGFAVETGAQEVDPGLGALAFLMGRHRYVRMVRHPASLTQEPKP